MKILQRISLTAMLVAILVMLMPADLDAQRRGGSFGGSRSSRSYSSPSRGGGSFGSRGGGGSFGSRRSSPSSSPYSGSGGRTSSVPRAQSSPSVQRNSFGGSRLSTSSDYTSRYGIPRKTERATYSSGGGGSTNYVVNRYGGMGDGFMMGYLMGSVPWYYSMPFHPAYYYSRPYTVANPDGTVSAYPGTFQWGTLFFTVLVVGGVAFIVYVWIRNRRRKNASGGLDMSRSSFG